MLLMAMAVFDQAACICRPHPIIQSQLPRLTTIGCVFQTILRKSSLEGLDELPGDDNDRWGSKRMAETVGPVARTSAPPSDGMSKSLELARLRDDQVSKLQSRPVNTAGKSSLGGMNGGGGSNERYLFIPEVTLVSIVGFTDLYGYKILRLHSRGELYLPLES